MSGQRYRALHDHVQVSTPVGGDVAGLEQTVTLSAGALLPGGVPAERIAHLLSVKMIEPIDAGQRLA